MKKFYTIALIAATVASASAGIRQTDVVKYSANPVQEKVMTVSSLKAKAPAKVSAFSSIDEVAGEYTWNYYGLLNGDSGYGTGTVTITVVNAATGEVTIDGIFSAGTGIAGKIKGTVDLAAGTLTLNNKQNLGPDSNGDLNYFYFKDLDAQGELIDGASTAASVTATINNKSFKFPELCVFAVGDFNDENMGWWKLTVENSFDEYVEPSDLIDLSEWNLYSTATMIDGWIVTSLKYNNGEYADPAEFPLTMNVLQSKADAKLFALVNPYTEESGFPLAGGEEGYIVLDLTYPDFVLVEPGVFCGYKNGASRLYCTNLEGFYVGMGYTKEVIQQALAGEVDEWSTVTETADNMVINIAKCGFNYAGAEDKFYSWNGRADAMKATITIKKPTDGVEGIVVDDANAAAEYFNLQGQRVAAPVKGNLYIKRQGTTTSKVVL